MFFPDIKSGFEFAYTCWEASAQFDDETARWLEECRRCTANSEIDKIAEKYPIPFLNYIDMRIREIEALPKTP